MRLGKIRTPHFRIVIADSRSARNSKAIEEIGRYSPASEPSLIEVNSERVQYWLGVGAQPTATVKNLLSKEGILYKKELLGSGLKEEEVTLKLDEWSKNKEAKLASKKAKKVEVKSQKEEKKTEEKIEEIVSDAEGTVSDAVQEEEKAE
jgi:small subunit ribosomal protein S16